MPELLIITALFVIVIWACAMWLLVAGDREQDFTDDEEPTLNVQNRKDED